MATIAIPILGYSTSPDTSGKIFLQPLNAAGGTGPFRPLLFAYANQPTGRQGVHGMFNVPPNYVSTPVFLVRWTTSAGGSNAVRWEIDYRRVTGENATAIDGAATEAEVGVTATQATTAFFLRTATITPTASNFAAGDTIVFQLFRDADDAADTLLATALLVNLIFQYSNV